ncbi:MAG: chitobiase/beta-hexosaminidase C-terminal domain-containing protein, partial [Planctomycetota bacterium]|nr:chitobiase/beta-hexosaminidase C-terminal domain-containing protein [Planctomycetota bacterium]
KTQDAQAWLKDAADYRKAIDEAQKKTGVAYFPPSWEKDGTNWGNAETLWPTEIFEPKDPRVAATIHYIHDEFEGGFKEGLIPWERGLGIHAFAELIKYDKRYANNETIPHTWGGVNYALMLRHMLVDERGDELHLLGGVPDWWLAGGREIRAERLATDFGEVSLVVRGTSGGVEVDVVRPARTAPKRIVLHLPKSRPLVRPIEGVDVVVREDQKEKWDYAKVVSLFRQEKDPKSPEPRPYEQAVLHQSPSRLSAQVEGLADPDKTVFLRQAKVELIHPDKGGRIRYTLDGSDPTETSPLYTGPLSLGETTTIKARGESLGKVEAGIPWSCTYQYQPFTVKVDALARIKVPGLFFAKTASVAFEPSAAGGVIRYTLDGKAPDATSPAYARPIVLEGTTTVTARCFDPAGKGVGSVFQERYTRANVEENLTTGKPATASQTGSGELPEFAVDGMVEVRSAFEPTFWGSSPYPQWWMVDLETVANLNEVHLYTFWGEGRYYQYTIEGSIDGKTWQTLADGSKNTRAADENGYKHTFRPMPVRYIRVNMLKNSGNMGVHIVEVRAYEDQK